jgi:cell division protein FtsL
MKKEEALYEEIETELDFTQRYFGLSLNKALLFLAIVVAFGIYIGILFYGTNSLEVLLGLEDYENYLQSEVVRLKDENAELQREYFELKEISAQ